MKRWVYIEEAKTYHEETYGIKKEHTAIIVTHFIGIFRDAILKGEFDQMAKELYEICKPQHHENRRSNDELRRVALDDRDPKCEHDE